MCVSDMAETSKNPLIDALPPVTDYITYLTLVEYNLTIDSLPTLQKVLEDETLTINIGWDLVHLLLPLLPDSVGCLNIIAALGNPREVLLKATESLQLLEFEEEDEEEEDNDDEEVKDDEEKDPKGQVMKPISVQKFEVLLSMLAVLHARIKTKYPSRFIATTLRAVYIAHEHGNKYCNILTPAALSFASSLSGKTKPSLPPRGSQNDIPIAVGLAKASDPEATPETQSTEDASVKTRLLQAFLTQVVETYVLCMSSGDDVPGLAWSSRVFERLQPRRTVPGKPTCSALFRTDKGLQARDATVKAALTMASELGLVPDLLLEAALNEDSRSSPKFGDDSEPPEDAEEIQLSQTGVLMLYSSMQASALFSDTPVTSRDIFPGYALLLRRFIGLDANGGASSAGLEPPALIDQILVLALMALGQSNVGEPKDDDDFNGYLQLMSLVSANTPSPSLRQHAHYITSTVLRSHPSEFARLSFIRDTLENCPYENLKTSAVSWIKGETIEASLPRQTSPGEQLSIFATPVALKALSPVLFPNLTQTFASTDVLQRWEVFRANLSFYLAALNFYYLLLTAGQLRNKLGVLSLQADVENLFIYPLRQASILFEKELGGGPLVEQEGIEGVKVARGDLRILEDVLQRVEKAQTLA